MEPADYGPRVPRKIHRIYSWNVNGMRSVAQNGFFDWLQKARADVVALQAQATYRLVVIAYRNSWQRGDEADVVLRHRNELEAAHGIWARIVLSDRAPSGARQIGIEHGRPAPGTLDR